MDNGNGGNDDSACTDFRSDCLSATIEAMK